MTISGVQKPQQTGQNRKALRVGNIKKLIMKTMLSTMVLLMVMLLNGCGTTKNVPKVVVNRNNAVFDYTPPTKAGIASSNMSIALIKPVFIKENPELLISPFPEMSLSMGNDFEELLAAKGFTMRGPFNSRDEMVYTEKVNSSFILEISIDIYPETTIFPKKVGVVRQGLVADLLLGPAPSVTEYETSGEVTFGGYLILTALSPQYGEKIWKKSIAIEKTTFPYKGSVVWYERPSMADQLRKDNVVYNKVVEQLEICYNKWLDLVWRQLDPEEMKIVTKQAKEADNKSSK